METATITEVASAAPAAADKTPRNRVVKESSTNLETMTVSLTFMNNVTRVFSTTTLAEEIRKRLELHGLKQKVSDKFNTAKGDSDAAIASADEIYDNLVDGEWSLAGSGEGPTPSLVIRAIARVRNKDLVMVKAIWKNLNEATRKGIAADDKIKRAILDIRHEDGLARAAEAAVASADLSMF